MDLIPRYLVYIKLEGRSHSYFTDDHAKAVIDIERTLPKVIKRWGSDAYYLKGGSKTIPCSTWMGPSDTVAYIIDLEPLLR